MFYLFAALLIAALLALSVIDLREYRLPDILTLPLIMAGLAQAYFLTGNIAPSLMGAASGYIVFVGFELAYRRLRGRDGLGRGDAKLLAAGGAWCGWAGLPLIVLIGSALALVALIFPSFKKMSEDGIIPFGPFLALAVFIVYMSQSLA